MGMLSDCPVGPTRCPSNVTLILILSDVCREKNWDDYLDQEEVVAARCSCYPLGWGVSVAAGAWCAVNAVAGFSGNLLTLLAIPAAMKSRR